MPLPRDPDPTAILLVLPVGVHANQDDKSVSRALRQVQEASSLLVAVFDSAKDSFTDMGIDSIANITVMLIDSSNAKKTIDDVLSSTANALGVPDDGIVAITPLDMKPPKVATLSIALDLDARSDRSEQATVTVTDPGAIPLLLFR